MTLADRRNVDSASVNRAERAATIRADNVTEAVDGMYRAVSCGVSGRRLHPRVGAESAPAGGAQRTAHRHQRRPAVWKPHPRCRSVTSVPNSCRREVADS